MKLVEVILRPEEAFDEDLLRSSLYSKLGIKDDGSTFVNVTRRSIDARSKQVIVQMQCEIGRAHV